MGTRLISLENVQRVSFLTAGGRFPSMDQGGA